MPHHAPSTRLPSSLALAALLAAAYAAPPEARAETPAPAAKALTFDVAAGPLDQVLLGISRQSGLLISFEQSLVRGRQAPAVRGPLSVDQALEQDLRGSGLQFRRSERGAVIYAAPLRAAVPAAKVQPLAAKAATIEGTNPSLAIVDEYHLHPDNRVYSALELGMGARPEALLFAITTAGSHVVSACKQHY
ncbi:hypothetical protein JTL60_32290, partial [Pseudomonas aeruginosa]|nr:hypothetical protein [Pseudomonas aeruginosa]